MQGLDGIKKAGIVTNGSEVRQNQRAEQGIHGRI